MADRLQEGQPLLAPLLSLGCHPGGTRIRCDYACPYGLPARNGRPSSYREGSAVSRPLRVWARVGFMRRHIDDTDEAVGYLRRSEAALW
jgi:hypothetical protein